MKYFIDHPIEEEMTTEEEVTTEGEEAIEEEEAIEIATSTGVLPEEVDLDHPQETTPNTEEEDHHSTMVHVVHRENTEVVIEEDTMTAKEDLIQMSSETVVAVVATHSKRIVHIRAEAHLLLQEEMIWVPEATEVVLQWIATGITEEDPQ